MKQRAHITISLAFACCALLLSANVRARAAQNSQTSAKSVDSAAAQSIAARMVPAQAVLDKELDAKKMQPGEQFRASLSETVHLKNGTELPRGTVLVGTIATDKMHSGGRQSTLALRFTKAELKDGKAIPIEAAIVGIAPPEYGAAWDGSDAQAPPDSWNGTALQVDDIGVLSGVDLHSKIAGQNSGVFVSTKKSDMKLAARSQMSLAIAPEQSTRSGGA